MIRLNGINKSYITGNNKLHVLKGIDLHIKAGEFVSIMGPSGSGKSTLLHLLGFLDRPDSGEYILGDTNVTKLTDDQLALLRNQ